MVISISPSQDDDQEIIAVRQIKNISKKLDNGVTSAAEISAGMGQIITFWKVLPEKWKKKSRSIFYDLWDKKKVVISDESQQVEDAYNVDFENEQMYHLVSSVNSYNRACLIAGGQVLDYWEKGLNKKGKEVRDSIEKSYGEEGMKVLNMVTTQDIDYVLSDMGDISTLDDSQTQEKFSDWVSIYNDISKRVKVSEVRNEVKELKEDIINLAKRTPKDFIVLHISAGSEDIMKLNSIVTELKENERLDYSSLDMEQYERGFQDVGKIEISF